MVASLSELPDLGPLEDIDLSELPPADLPPEMLAWLSELPDLD